MTASTRSNDGMFNNMVFAITNVGRVEDSERLKAHISSNGGTILDNGFDELFHIPPLPRTTGPKDPSADDRFELTLAAKTLGFTCLIADKYCRRAKYVQALALGIPCLATRWITDCVTKQRVLPWAPYLLPSGESSFLNGAVRSRILQPFAAETSTLSDIVVNRPKLLDNASVLLIMGKNQEETMKQHPLITHALGASKIARAINEDAAVKAVNDGQALGEPWDWVFSYDKEKAVEDRLFGTNQTGRKRKRGRESEARAGQGREKRVKTRVVGNEFVIQSLILGMLVEE
jgi:tRNA-splicing endonuclease subunit Sen2